METLLKRFDRVSLCPSLYYGIGEEAATSSAEIRKAFVRAFDGIL